GICVAVTTLTGRGHIQASGGKSASGGGGGRVAVYAQDFSAFDLASITSPGGGGDGTSGGAGTVFLRDTDEPDGTLIIEQRYGQGTGSTPLGLPGQTTFSIPDKVVIRGDQQYGVGAQVIAE